MSICNDKEQRDRWQEDAAERDRDRENAARHAEPVTVIGSCGGLAVAIAWCADSPELVAKLEAYERYVRAIETELIGYRCDMRLHFLRCEVEFQCSQPTLDRAAILRACARSKT